MNDLISRQEAIDAVSDCGICIQRILDLPSAQPEQKHGKWTEKHVKDADWLFHRRFYCSVCGDWQTHGDTDYCPNCGAKMDMERE